LRIDENPEVLKQFLGYCSKILFLGERCDDRKKEKFGSTVLIRPQDQGIIKTQLIHNIWSMELNCVCINI
jgi:hypothetical protein